MTRSARLTHNRDPRFFAIVHPSTRPGEKAWQVTRFDDEGPVGHTSRDTFDEAVKVAQWDGYDLDEVTP